MELSALLSACSLDDLTRIDVGLEGDWSPTVKTVWTRNDGRLNLSVVVREHESFKPSLELYFVDGWIGLHCCCWDGQVNVLDESLVERVIDDVEAAIALSK
jgi:hypothetical protein